MTEWEQWLVMAKRADERAARYRNSGHRWHYAAAREMAYICRRNARRVKQRGDG